MRVVVRPKSSHRFSFAFEKQLSQVVIVILRALVVVVVLIGIVVKSFTILQVVRVVF